MTKKTITYKEYLQALGLITLANKHNEQLKIIEQALLDITEETDRYSGERQKVWEGSHCGEAVTGGASIDELIDKLGITIQKEKQDIESSVQGGI